MESIEQKLKDNEYATVSAIESDFKRLVQNAKDFNDPGSVIYEDAERMRKLVFNYMKQHNPAYKDDPKYIAVSTPLPQATNTKSLPNGTRKVESEAGDTESRQPREKPKRAATEQSERKSSQAPSATTGEAGDEDDDDGGDDEKVEDDLDFTGMTFQAAQQAIIAYLLRYTDDE